MFAADIIRTDDGYLTEGTISIKDVNLPISFPFDLTVEGETAQMTGTLTLDRRDFAIGESTADESNLGFTVDVMLSLTATRTEKGAAQENRAAPSE